MYSKKKMYYDLIVLLFFLYSSIFVLFIGKKKNNDLSHACAFDPHTLYIQENFAKKKLY